MFPGPQTADFLVAHQPELLVLPNPLHPAVVHFPIVLAILAPLVLAGTWFAMRRSVVGARAWFIPVALIAMLAASTWLSELTGEDQEEKVESVVSEAAIETHEEAAQLLLVGSTALLGLAALGLLTGQMGKVARPLSVVASLFLILLSWKAGHTGGQLVYGGNAGSAYANSTPVGIEKAGGSERDREREGDDRR